MQLGIVGQKGNPRAQSLVEAIGRSFLDDDVAVLVDSVTAEALSEQRGRGYGPSGNERFEPDAIAIEELDTCDLVVSIGGDGTFLYAARGVGDTPIMGVNLGEVGFLNAIAPDDAIETIHDVVDDLREDGETPTREISRVQASGEDWTLPPSLNEVVIQGPQRGHGNGIGVTVRIDGSLYTSGHADGVLVATPTGSTAYNLSEAGPLVHPNVDALVVTEMAAELEMPPLVVEEDSEITIHVEGDDGATVVTDGRVSEDIETPSRVTLGLADESVRVAGPPLDFFAALGKLE
ncbi:NAD(+)/NADH kinase [Halapricum hydrolyticum]|uniref:NAD kinase n=1 Tax=Halapricum hydrolyticum TaxID=2979991 RepID=A0AAE3IBP9_9EURY|nr:NAD(+)/NADH kinase [Halapricum hydrolyticum]MCU4717881.1 NAD(+)/NADH kinase [Halapricum hydrolyticum]MCU4727046.1 NAD(+)/NADH kinase [Halapricum hydrolyticum]